MQIDLYCRAVDPSTPVAVARSVVSRCVEHMAARPSARAEGDDDVGAPTSLAGDAWDDLAAEVQIEAGLSLDAPWPDWYAAALSLDRVRARRALCDLAWYAAARSGRDDAYQDLLRRAGLSGQHGAPKRKEISSEEGIRNIQALMREMQLAGAGG